MCVCVCVCLCVCTEVLTLVFDMLTSEIDVRLKVSFTRALCIVAKHASLSVCRSVCLSICFFIS